MVLCLLRYEMFYRLCLQSPILFSFLHLMQLDEIAESSAHIMVIEVGSSLRVLILRARVIIEVDSLVVVVVKVLIFILLAMSLSILLL